MQTNAKPIQTNAKSPTKAVIGINNNIKIGENCVVGSGSVVINDIKKNQSKKDICKELILKFRKSILFRSNDYLIINKWKGILL